MSELGTRSVERQNADQPIVGLPVSTSAFVIRSLRGPMRPVKVNDLGKARRVFGAQDPNSYWYESVKGFFAQLAKSAGGAARGADLWLQRVVGTGETGTNVKAAFTLQSAAAVDVAGSLSSGATAFPVALVNGDTFITQVNGAGGPFTKTVIANRATLTLSGGSYAAGAGGESVTIRRTISGVLITTVVDLSTATNKTDYIALLNGLTGIKAVDSGSDIVLTVDQAGSGSAGNITTISGASVTTKLGATVSAFTLAGGSNVANVDQVTAAEVALICATAGSVFSTSNGGRQLNWITSTPGAGGSVQFTGGTAIAKITGLDNVLHSGNSSPAAVDTITMEDVGTGSGGNEIYGVTKKVDRYIGGLSALVSAGSTTQFTLTAAAAAAVKVGDTLYFVDSVTAATARGYVSKLSGKVVTLASAVTVGSGGLTVATTKVYTEKFSLSVYDASGLLRSETDMCMSALSKQNYFVTRWNTGIDEQQVTLTDESAAITADNRPINTVATGDFLVGGEEDTTFLDTDWIGSSASTPKTGFYGFDSNKKIRRMAVPGITGDTEAAVSLALINYCANRETIRAEVDTPLGLDASQVANYRANFPSLSYGTLRAGWVKVLDDLTGQLAFKPQTGFAMGANARCNANRPISKAPAGTTDGMLFGVQGVEYDLTSSEESDFIDANANFVKHVDAGYCLWMARTLQIGKANESQIHVRDTLIYLRTSMDEGTLYLFEEPATEETRGKVTTTLENFLGNEWASRGVLQGASAEEAYKVQCDDQNNPKFVQKSQQTVAEVWVNIPDTTELLLIYVNNSMPAQESV